jgi:D-alanyl-D-alanine carboxypeptidase
MKTTFLAVIALLTTYLRLSPEAAIVLTQKTDNQRNLPINQQIIEYTQDTEIKPYAKSSSSTAKWWAYPANIKETTRSGDDLLVLVNKEYKLTESYAPQDLVLASTAGITGGSSFYLRNIVIEDLRRLVNAATTNSINLSIVSGYRSYATQIDTYNYWVRVNGGNTDIADTISARAGHSQHQLGTAIDFSSSEVSDGSFERFQTTQASAWLVLNAWKYGFVISYPSGYESTTGYSYESWHYRYIGVANAQEMHNSGMILEVYLESKN